MLYLLEIADVRGRDCRDAPALLETLEWFRLAAEEAEVWEPGDPYASWAEVVRAAVGSEKECRRAMGEAIRLFENGEIHSPEEALAKTYQHRKDFAEVTVLSGPAGCGKSTWAARNLPPGALMLSLDALRAELAGRRSDQSRDGFILQTAKERLRAALRAKQDVIWDATSLRKDGRAMVLDLARSYHAHTRIVAFAATEAACRERNRNRAIAEAIPESVIARQFERWEWPEVWEAHEVSVVAS